MTDVNKIFGVSKEKDFSNLQTPIRQSIDHGYSVKEVLHTKELYSKSILVKPESTIPSVITIEGTGAGGEASLELKAAGGNWSILADDGSDLLRIFQDTTARMAFNSTGVGVGITPTSNLDVRGAGLDAFPATSGSTLSTGARVRVGTATSTRVLDVGNSGGTGFWLQATNNGNYATNYPLMLNPNGGNVGIGTTSPGTNLEVVTTNSGTVTYPLIIRNNADQINTRAGIFFQPTTASALIRGAAIEGYQETGSNQVGLSFLTGNAATINEKLRINYLGDMYFVGSGTGLPYGSCYGNEIAWTQASAAQNTWYLVSDADMIDGPLNLFTHDGSGKLTATNAGTYKIDMAISMQCSGVNKHLEYGVSINGASPVMYQREYFPAISEEQHGSLSRIITLTAGQTIELAVRTTDTGTPNLQVDNLSITVVMIGG